MASVSNSFDLLLAGGEQETTKPSQSRKRRSKAKAKNLAAVQNGDEAPAPSQGASVAPDATPAVTPADEEVAGNLEGFQEVRSSSSSARQAADRPGKGNRKAEVSAPPPIPPVQDAPAKLPETVEPVPPASNVPVPAASEPAPTPADAEKAALEAAARAFAGSESRRAQLWYDWITAAQNARPEPHFDSLTWKQVLLQSQALEITVAACLQPPISASNRHHLQTLLATFLASPEAGQVMAQVVLDLGQGLAAGPPDPNLLISAQQALTASLTALKEGETGWAVQALAARLSNPTLAEKLKQLSSKSAEVEQQLGQLSTDPNEAATLAERTRLSQQLVAMSEQQLVLLLPDDAPDDGQAAVPKDAPSLRALNTIRHLAAQIRDSRSVEPASVAAPKAAPPPGEQPTPIDKRRELQGTAVQLAEEGQALQAQLAAAEKEVERLRAAVASVEARRQLAEAQLEAAAQDDGSDLPGLDAQQLLQQQGGGQVPQIQLWCAQQLGVIHTLEALLLRPPEAGVHGGSHEEEEAVSAVMCRAVLEHLQALATHAGNKQQQLKEAGQRLHFSQAKLADMEANLARLKSQGRMQLVKELEKPKEMYLNMTKDWSTRVEAILADAEGVESALQRPAMRTAVALLPPQPPVHMLLNQISHILHQVRMEYSSVKAGPPPPQPVVPAVPQEQVPSDGPADRAVQRSAPGKRREGNGGPARAPGAGRGGEGGQQRGRRQQGGPPGGPKLPEVAGSEHEGHLGRKVSHSNGHIPIGPPKENAWGVPRPLTPNSELAALGFQQGESAETPPGGAGTEAAN